MELLNGTLDINISRLEILLNIKFNNIIYNMCIKYLNMNATIRLMRHIVNYAYNKYLH